jgi:hypothetical protein
LDVKFDDIKRMKATREQGKEMIASNRGGGKP